LVGGKVSSQPSYFLKYSENGDLDVNFGNNGILTPVSSGNSIPRTLITPNDKILLSGKTETGGATVFYLEQYNNDGTLDASFGNNGIILYPFAPQGEFSVSGLIVHNNWYLLSLKEIINNIAVNYLVRFSVGGILDDDYGDSGYLSIPIESEYGCTPIVIPGLEDIYLNCSYYDEVLQDYFFKMTKLSPNGSLDTTFGNGGYQIDRYANIVQPNGRILDLDSYVDFEGGIVTDLFRYYGGGAIDTSFNYSQNYTELEYGVFLILRNSGKLLVASTSAWYNGAEDIVLLQYNNNPLSVTEFNLKNLKIFPNPSTGSFIIQFDSDAIGSEIPYQIVEISGKIIQPGVLSSFQTILDLSNIQSGIYLLKTPNGTARLIKN
jgi:uncharacterized delta-60 repeat protein